MKVERETKQISTNILSSLFENSITKRIQTLI